mmetsp:Transcript_31599/g.70861  ORF Transcript_31599/g.70861 Transcript_31599/m.70861 type:complete len:198 (-) Transcript_31599:65-658(-)
MGDTTLRAAPPVQAVCRSHSDADRFGVEILHFASAQNYSQLLRSSPGRTFTGSQAKPVLWDVPQQDSARSPQDDGAPGMASPRWADFITGLGAEPDVSESHCYLSGVEPPSSAVSDSWFTASTIAGSEPSIMAPPELSFSVRRSRPQSGQGAGDVLSRVRSQRLARQSSWVSTQASSSLAVLHLPGPPLKGSVAEAG